MKKTLIFFVFLMLVMLGFGQVDTISTNIYQNDGKLGIGISNPSSVLELIGDGAVSYPDFGIFSIKNSHYATLDAFSASDYFYVGSLFNGRRARGTLEAPLNIQPEDRITGIIAAMYYNNEFYFNSSIEFYAGNELSSYSLPSYIVFRTTGENELSRSERMRLSGEGFLGLGTPEPMAKLDIADGDIFIEDIDRGIIMKSPDGRCWKGTMDNSGSLNFHEIDCPVLITRNSDLEKSIIEIELYPNPADNYITVNISDKSLKRLYYTISNIDGKEIKKGLIKAGYQLIDTGSLATGTYIISFYDKKRVLLQTKKFIKH